MNPSTLDYAVLRPIRRIEAIRAVAITVAVTALLLFGFRYAVEAVSITVRGAWGRPFFYHGGFVGRVMSCGTWVLAATLLYLVAPLADRLPGLRGGASVRPLLFSTAGAVLTMTPPLFWIAQMVVYALKMTVYRSWATEGRIFTSFDVYPHNMLLTLLPWSLSGLCLLLVCRAPSTEDTSAPN
jgi:hypothetical protein